MPSCCGGTPYLSFGSRVPARREIGEGVFNKADERLFGELP